MCFWVVYNGRKSLIWQWRSTCLELKNEIQYNCSIEWIKFSCGIFLVVLAYTVLV